MKPPADGSREPIGSTLGSRATWFAIGLVVLGGVIGLPGGAVAMLFAYVIAGLSAPVHPILTGFLLGLVSLLLFVAHWAITQPTFSLLGERPQLVSLSFIAALGVIAVGVATLVTGSLGYAARWILRGR